VAIEAVESRLAGSGLSVYRRRRFPEHDPEKQALGLDPGVEAGFPSGQTRSVCPEIMLKQKIVGV
jgi:hypothetical protein